MKLFEYLGLFEAEEYKQLPSWIMNSERMLYQQLPESDKRKLEASS